MKKTLILLILILVSTGCAERGTRTVSDGMLISTAQPPLHMELGSTFKLEEKNTDIDDYGLVFKESYVYAEDEGKLKDMRVVIFSFARTTKDYRWNNNLYDSLVKGKALVSDSTFDTGIDIIVDWTASEKERSTSLVKRFRLYSGQGYLCNIAYFEFIDPVIGMALHKWKEEKPKTRSYPNPTPKHPMSEELRQTILDFDNRADATLAAQ